MLEDLLYGVQLARRGDIVAGSVREGVVLRF